MAALGRSCLENRTLPAGGRLPPGGDRPAPADRPESRHRRRHALGLLRRPSPGLCGAEEDARGGRCGRGRGRRLGSQHDQSQRGAGRASVRALRRPRPGRLCRAAGPADGRERPGEPDRPQCDRPGLLAEGAIRPRDRRSFALPPRCSPTTPKPTAPCWIATTVSKTRKGPPTSCSAGARPARATSSSTRTWATASKNSGRPARPNGPSPRSWKSSRPRPKAINSWPNSASGKTVGPTPSSSGSRSRGFAPGADRVSGPCGRLDPRASLGRGGRGPDEAQEEGLARAVRQSARDPWREDPLAGAAIGTGAEVMGAGQRGSSFWQSHREKFLTQRRRGDKAAKEEEVVGESALVGQSDVSLLSSFPSLCRLASSRLCVKPSLRGGFGTPTSRPARCSPVRARRDLTLPRDVR